MQIGYTAEKIERLDEPVYQAAAERQGEPLRLRLQATLLRGNGRDAQHRNWPNVCWNLECDTPEEVLALRDALRAFFDTVAAVGPAATAARLGTLQ